MGRSKRGKRGRQPQGFSNPETRPLSNWLARSLGTRGRDKRQFFNQLSTSMVVGAALAGSFFGYHLIGWVGALAGLFVGGSVMSTYVIRNRYYR